MTSSTTSLAAANTERAAAADAIIAELVLPTPQTIDVHNPATGETMLRSPTLTPTRR